MKHLWKRIVPVLLAAGLCFTSLPAVAAESEADLPGDIPAVEAVQEDASSDIDVSGEQDVELPVVTGDETSNDTGEELSKEIEGEIPGETGEEMSGETGGEIPNETGEEAPEEIGEEMPGETGEETPGETGEETPEETGEETPGETGEETSDDAGAELMGETGDETPATDYEISLNGDHRVYSDGPVDVQIDMSPATREAWENGTIGLSVLVGIPDEPEWRFTAEEDVQFTVEGTTITLDGTRLFEAVGESDIMVAAVLTDTESQESVGRSDDFWMHVQEASVDYWLEYNFSDRFLLPEWGDTVDRFQNGWIENADHPGGQNFQYEVTDVQISVNDPAEEGKEVLLLRQDTNETGVDYWWYFEGLNHGEAVLTISYQDLDGNAQNVTMNVHVYGTVYNLSLWIEDDGIALPGETIAFQAMGIRYRYHEPETTDGLTYRFSLDEKGATLAKIEVDPDNPARAIITMNELPEGQEGIWENFTVKTELFDGEELYIMERSFQAIVSSDYLSIWPVDVNVSLNAGGSEEIMPELRHYSLGLDQYEVIDKDIHYRWYYDPNCIEIKDENGVVVGNNDEEGNYMDSPDSYGAGKQFTITRKLGWGTGINLCIDFTDDEGNPQVVDWGYWYPDLNYDFRLESDTDRLYSDGTLEVRAEASDSLLESLKSGAMSLEYELITGNGTVLETETYAQKVGNNLLLDGAKLFEDGWHIVTVIARIMDGEAEVIRSDRWFTINEARVEYEMEQDRDMLPGWDGTVNQDYDVYQENTNYPDGYNERYIVTNVEITNTWGGNEEGPAIVMNKDQDENGYWWYYRAETFGGAELTVTYEDVDGNEASYTFNLNVGTDVYDMDVRSEGSRTVLPGKSIVLRAQVWHHSVEGEKPTDDITYQWAFTDPRFAENRAALVVDETDSSKATVIFEELPADDDEWYHFDISVTAYDGEEVVAVRFIDVHTSNYYEEIWPVEINTDMDIGETQEIEMEERLYDFSLDSAEGYELAEDVSWFWYYDSNAIEIRDAEGQVIGNNDEEDNYHGSAASTGTKVKFTIKRLREWGTNIHVSACWTDENGDERSSDYDYWMDNKDYNIWFDPDEVALYDDYQVTLNPNVEQLGQMDYTLQYELGAANEEGVFEVLIPEDAYEIQDGQVTIYYEKLGDFAVTYDRINVRVRLMYQDLDLDRDAWCWVRFEKSCGEHNWLEGRDEPSCDHTGKLWQWCRLCGETREEELPMIPHTPGEMTIENEVLPIQSAAHTWDEVVYCTVCQQELSRESKTEEVKAEIEMADTAFLKAGSEQKAEATVTPEVVMEGAVWTSSDETVATVDPEGLIKALAAGETTITLSVQSGSVTKECKVTVYEDVTVALSPEEAALKVGETLALEAAITPEAMSAAAVWESSNQDVAAVDEQGIVTAINYGTATITLTVPDGETTIKKSCEITVQFTDVMDSGRYYYDPVYWAAENGITVGHGGPGLFSPDASCTREQFVTFLWRSMGKPAPKSKASFVDVPEDAWYADPISWAFENHITFGLNDGTGRFGVGQPCTREQCVTFLYRAAGSPGPVLHDASTSFTDVTPSAYYYDAVAWAKLQGVTVGLNDGTGRFGVGQACSRAMLVTFLYRYAVTD